MKKNPKVAYVTAGAAGMFCGSCMRDNTLAAAARELGCDVVLVPTFTPIRTDEDDVSTGRVFLGGLNLYLGHRYPAWRRLPAVFRRGLDHPRILRAAGKLALQQRGEDDGELVVSMLAGESGPHEPQIQELVGWLADEYRPDVVNLTNLLIGGFVPALKRRLEVPVLVTLQGDDILLDALGEDDAARALTGLRRLARSIDGFLVFSEYYRDFMAGLLEVPRERFHVTPLGLAAPEAFAPSGEGRPDGPPTVGYLARVCPEKGFDLLVDAYLRLREMPGTGGARLRAAGWLGAGDRELFARQRRKLADAGVGFELDEIPRREDKIRFLHQLDVVSVPATYREPKGLYVLESLAAGVPVVLPDHGAFPEILAASGGGVLFPPGDAHALAAALHELLTDPERRRRLGREGRRRVAADLHAEAAARRTIEVWRSFL